MASKQQLIIGAWATVGGIAGVTTYRSLRDFEKRHPYVQEAVRELKTSRAAQNVLGNGDWRVAKWPRHGKMDSIAGRACASFDIHGESGFMHVCVGAQRELDKDDDEDTDVTGWRYYWSKPWEIKFKFLERFRAHDEPDKNTSPWEIDALMFLPNGDASCPNILIGDPRSIPEYETLCVRRDGESKSEKSRLRLQRLLIVATAGALLAGGFRLVRSMRVSKSYGFVKNSLFKHNDIVAAVGGQIATVQTISGTFGAKYINARLQVMGVSGTAVDVDIAAIRDGGTKSAWRVALARMNTNGLIYNLDKAQFQLNS